MVKIKRPDPNVVQTRKYSTDAVLREKQIRAPFRKSHPGPPRSIPKTRGYSKSSIKKKKKRFLHFSQKKGFAAKKSGIEKKQEKKKKTKKEKSKVTKNKKIIHPQNVRKKKYRGVQVNKKSGKFFTQKVLNGKNRTLGTFFIAEEAAECFDLETFRHKGRSYKHYNFPNNLDKYEKIVAAEKQNV